MIGVAALQSAAPVPVTILTGFLGAGKTTLLNALLQHPSLSETAVMVNEFGEIGIDHALVDAVQDDMLVLSTGCICCAARGKLLDGFKSLMERRRAGQVWFDRIIVETTGISDPAPVLNAVLFDPDLLGIVRMGAVITVVDALGGTDNLMRYPEALRQVGVADAIVLSKIDLASRNDGPVRAVLERAIDALNPGVPIMASQDVGAVIATVLDPSLGFAGRKPGVRAGLDEAQHHHAETLRATCLRAGPIDIVRLHDFIQLLSRRCGAGLLRLKGLVATIEDPTRPLLVQVVGHMIHPSRRLPGWPDGDRRTRIVAITQGVEASSVSELWSDFFGPPAIDRPDAVALTSSLGSGPGLF